MFPHSLNDVCMQQTSAELGQLLKKLQGQEQLDEYQAAVVREGLREHIKLTAVPKELEKRRSELESEGYQVLNPPLLGSP